MTPTRANLAEIRELVHRGLVVIEYPPGVIHADARTIAHLDHIRRTR